MHCYFGISGIRSIDQIKSIHEFVDRINIGLFVVNLGIYCDKEILKNGEKIKEINALIEETGKYPKLVPVLHHSFRFSNDPIKEIECIKSNFAHVKYLQINDLKGDHLEILKTASQCATIILPLENKTFELLSDREICRILKENKAMIMLDNSKGCGLQAKSSDYEKKVNDCLERGLVHIALAGGFGPDHLSPYVALRDQFRMNFSIDAESALKTNGELDINKAKDYIYKLAGI